MSKQPVVVFDLDGTLVNSAPDLLASLNHCLQAFDLKTIGTETLQRLIGQGGRVMIERAVTAQGIAPEPDYIDKLAAVFQTHYGRNIPGETRYFEGAEPALAALQKAGYRLAVCTNKAEHLAKPLLQALGQPDRYAAISGGDTYPWRKPDPRHILDTVKAAGGDASRTVMVGDSAADINAAKAANVPVIAVDFGYTDIPVQELGPTAIISSFAELTPQLVASLLD